MIDSTLPHGGGLASSAALEVATATLLETITRKPLAPVEKALLCQQAEHDFAGVPCGIMDQFTSVRGQKDQALLLDCRSREATPVPMTDPGVTVLIINTNIRHRLAEGEYAQRRAQCETATRVLGVPSLRDASSRSSRPLNRASIRWCSGARGTSSAKTSVCCNLPPPCRPATGRPSGRIMYASHASLRDDYEVSCAELDAVVEIAQSLGEAAGMLGCRMTGGGFGGCAVSLVKTDAVKLLTRKLDAAYERKMGSQVSIFACRPAAGARVLK